MTPYTVTLNSTTPQAAGAALANMVANNAAAKRYLDDVNDSAHYPAAYLLELIIDAFALTDAEAQSVYNEWLAEVE